MIRADFNKYLIDYPYGSLGDEIQLFLRKYRLRMDTDYTWDFDRDKCTHNLEFFRKEYELLFLLEFGHLC